MSEAAIEALAQGRHGDPFALLGPQREGEQWVVRALLPGAPAVTALGPSGETLAAFRRVHEAELFGAEISDGRDHRLCIDWDGAIQETEGPYSFPPLLGELDVYLLAEGRHRRLQSALARTGRRVKASSAFASPSGRRTRAGCR
jgi:1,4-alpha-glucan branching enzyme